jgi:sec-independent protein translocase protein TatA
MNLGVTELLIVLAVVLLLFGSTRLPALARSLGEAKREFHDGERDS